MIKLRVSFLGAAGEVGRSCILIKSAGASVLLDSGIKLGAVNEYPALDSTTLKGIDAVVVSHAHLDHSGYLPHLYSEGYRGPIYATKPTLELINVLVSDYLNISNPEGVRKGAVQSMQRYYNIAEYHKEFSINGLKIKLVPAGHILGSAMIEASDGKNRLLYTGDVNFRTTKLLDPAYTEHLTADTLITESTYGGDADTFPSERSTLNRMALSIKETLNNGGNVVMPSFGVGRAQELLLVLDDYMKSGSLPTVPIYTDGMVNKALRIHRHNVIYCRDELQKRILMNDDDPFKSKNFVPVITSQQRNRIMHGSTPGIIVTTSGMLTGGPILKYMAHMARSESNKLILVGYQAEGTRGRVLLEGSRSLEIDGRKVEVRMAVEQYHFSAHADRPQLLHFIGKIKGLRNIFIVHGESEKAHQLMLSLNKRYNTVVPLRSESFTV